MTGIRPEAALTRRIEIRGELAGAVSERRRGSKKAVLRHDHQRRQISGKLLDNPPTVVPNRVNARAFGSGVEDDGGPRATVGFVVH